MGSLLQYATLLFVCWMIRGVVTNPNQDEHKGHKHKHKRVVKKHHKGPLHFHNGFMIEFSGKIPQDDDNNTNNNNGKVDFESNYGEIHKFFEGLTFEKFQKNKKAQNTFYKYFGFHVESKSVFEFIKFCFKFNKTPENFGTYFSSILNEILAKNLDKVPADYYGKFLSEVSGKNQQDFGKKYKTIHTFLKDLNFKDVQTTTNKKKFYNFFKFYPKNEKVFNFIKYCFQSPNKPTNFDTNFSSIWYVIMNTNFSQVIDNYNTIFTNIISGKDTDSKGDNKDNGNNNKDNGNNNKENGNNNKDNGSKSKDNGNKSKDNGNGNKDGSDNKDNGNNNKGNGNNNKDNGNKSKNNGNKSKDNGNNSKNNGNDNKDGSDNEDNGNNNKDNGDDSDKDTNGNTGDIDYDADYEEISDFLSSISFKDLQDEENRQTFYNYFKFDCKSESVFNFLKFCFHYSKKPSDFSIHFTPLLNVILNLNLNEIPEIFYTMLTNNLSIKNNGYQSDFGEDYESIYSFLNNLNYAKLQTEDNWETFFTIFSFYPVSESMFDFVKYCFQYQEKPANLETNFQECIMEIFESNCDIKSKFYIDFAKYLLGESELNYVDNYNAVFEFLKDLTYDEAKSGDDWDTFYYYFQCYPASESMFKFFKYCYQYEQKPTNFDANFWSVLQRFLNSNSEDVSDTMYTIFDNNLFGSDDSNNNQQDVGANYYSANYGSIYTFLGEMTFDKVQTNENRQKFYNYFNFYPESESIFDFMKYCFQYSVKPANFEENFSNALNAVSNLGPDDEVSTHMYTQFSKNLFGGKYQFYKGKYQEVHNFLKGSTFEDVESGKNWDLFYYYFECYPVSESLFNFIKFCFRYDVEPDNFETNFQNCLNIIFDSDTDEVSDDLYITFVKNLFNGNTYKAIHYFLESLTFEEVQKPQFREIFYYYFKFYPKNEGLFDLVKYCFQFSEKPVNFEKNFQATLAEYEDSGDEQASEELRETFMHNLFGDDDQNGEGGNNNGQSGNDNGNSWSYSWNSGNQGGNSNSGYDQNSEWHYYYE